MWILDHLKSTYCLCGLGYGLGYGPRRRQHLATAVVQQLQLYPQHRKDIRIRTTALATASMSHYTVMAALLGVTAATPIQQAAPSEPMMLANFHKGHGTHNPHVYTW